MLREYQKNTIEFIKSNKKCGVFHECGLGKTRCVMEALNDLRLNDILWITKAGLREGVSYEWDKWFKSSFPGLVVSYQWFLKSANVGLAAKYKTIVIDEAHNVKSYKGKIANAVRAVAKFADRVIWMTATPYVRFAGDLWGIVDNCVGVGGYWQFLNKYANKVPDRFAPSGFKFEGVKNVAELKAMLNKFSVRFTRSQVLSELPSVVRAVVTLSDLKLDSLSEAELRALEIDKVTAEVLQKYKACGLAKVTNVMEWISDNGLEDGLVVCWHKDVATKYSELLGCKCVSGDTPFSDRLKAVAEFQAGAAKWLVLTMAASGEGLNIDAAKNVLFAEVNWSPAVMYQSLSRAVRMTTKHTVFVNYFVANSGIDAAIAEVSASKKSGARDLGVAYGA